MPREKLILIKTLKDLNQLNDYLKDKQVIAVDSETTGVDQDAEIIGYSVCAENNVGYYVVISYWDVEQKKLVYLETKDGIKQAMEGLQHKSLLMHNALFDCDMIRRSYGVDLMPYVHCDTMIAAHLLDENRRCGLKDLALAIFGETATKEQKEMKDSVSKNGGKLTKDNYELYKADADLIGRYGAKDTILTWNLFWLFDEQLEKDGLAKFFYEEESMPLLRGPTYDLNTTGLRVDLDALQKLRGELEAEILEAKAYVNSEIKDLIQDYPGTIDKKVGFNVGSSNQLAWLLFEKLGNLIPGLTDTGKAVCKALGLKIPYSNKAKLEFINAVKTYKGRIYGRVGEISPVSGEPRKREAKIEDFWKYVATDEEALRPFTTKYRWVKRLAEMGKAEKILSTYVIAIQNKTNYGVVRPSFIQAGPPSGRYASKEPNFQNLPRDDKRVKKCIIAREGKIFVGADQEQLEPRCFASTSQDEALMNCFSSGEDFYSVVGAPIFDKTDCSLFKGEPGSFSEKYPQLRNKAKVIALATPYGRTAGFMAAEMGVSIDEAKDLMESYFRAYPKVEAMMLLKHEEVKANGVVYSTFGRPRRIPEAKFIPKGVPHNELPYEHRNLLNQAVNHDPQSSGASIMNRGSIAIHSEAKERSLKDPRWAEVKIVVQVHDELVLEGPEPLADDMAELLRWGLEDTTTLPGVKLKAKPNKAYNLADLK